jgi:hypothetical protein
MLYIKKSYFFLFLKDITNGADLTLVFIDDLNEETLAMSYYYKIVDKKTTILLKRPVLLPSHIWFLMFQCCTVRP